MKKKKVVKKEVEKPKMVNIKINYEVNTKGIKEALALMKQLESVTKRVKSYLK